MRLGQFQRHRRMQGADSVVPLPAKALLAHVADLDYLTLTAGNDLVSWANLVSGGAAAGYSASSPASPAKYVTDQFGGVGSIHVGSAPPYYPVNTLGSLSNWWFGLSARTQNTDSSNRIILGGGTQFACATSTGNLSVFDGGYKASTAQVTQNTDYTLLWVLNGATSYDVYVNGVLADSGVALDGGVGTDNLTFTFGGYSKSAGLGVSHIRAVIGGNVSLSPAEISEVHSWLDSKW